MISEKLYRTKAAYIVATYKERSFSIVFVHWWFHSQKDLNCEFQKTLIWLWTQELCFYCNIFKNRRAAQHIAPGHCSRAQLRIHIVRKSQLLTTKNVFKSVQHLSNHSAKKESEYLHKPFVLLWFHLEILTFPVVICAHKSMELSPMKRTKNSQAGVDQNISFPQNFINKK